MEGAEDGDGDPFLICDLKENTRVVSRHLGGVRNRVIAVI